MPQKWSQNIYVKNPTQRCVKTANKVKPKICGIISTKKAQYYFDLSKRDVHCKDTKYFDKQS